MTFSEKRALVIDLGGTHANCAIVEDKTIVAHETLFANPQEGLTKLLPHFERTLKSLLEKASLSTKDCVGLAFGFCGVVDFRSSQLLSTNLKYDDAPGLDISGWSGQVFGLPLRIENDARMTLLGEWYAGAAQGFSDIVTMTLGTGIGGAAMIDGRLVRGKHAQAGCLGGHIPVQIQGRPCTCGNVGCAEAEASGWSLPEIVREWPGYDRSVLSKNGLLDFEELFNAASCGDRVAQEVQMRCLRVWAANAVGLIHAFDPEILIIGGGVMNSAEIVVPFVQEHVSRHAWTPWGKVEVRPAKLGTSAGLLGAIPLLSEPR
ncbi:MAG: ROK family protein [Candidatus Acidiferrales bacterium]